MEVTDESAVQPLHFHFVKKTHKKKLFEHNFLVDAKYKVGLKPEIHH